MTLQETSASLRRLADAFDNIRLAPGGDDIQVPRTKPILTEDAAVGAAGFLCYLRDCLTATPKEQWSQGEILVLLETMSRDPELFPFGVGELMWQMETEG